MVSLKEMPSRLRRKTELAFWAMIVVILVIVFATPQLVELPGARGNPSSTEEGSAIVYQWEISPATTKITLSLIDPKATPKFTIRLYGCWVWGEILGEAPGFIQGDWSSSPFYMAVKNSQIVKVKTAGVWVPATATIDWDAGTVTVQSSTAFSAVAIKFSIKQPSIHSGNTLPNL